MNKAGKSPPPVQTNRNINNPPPILTFKFCIRLADLSLAVKYKFYWCATSTRSPNSISCQYNFMSFYQHLKIINEKLLNNALARNGTWQKLVTGHTPVIPLALIVHNIWCLPGLLIIITSWEVILYINIKIVKSQERVRNLGLWLLY